MMMQCLKEGGMTVASDESFEFLNRSLKVKDTPNPGGFYNLYLDETTVPLIQERYQGKALKVWWQYLLAMPQGEYKVILMKRDPEEIRLSMQKFLPGDWLEARGLVVYDLVFPAMVKALEAKGMEITVVDYATMVQSPLTTLSQLAASGWPINAAQATTTVDIALYRSKV